MALDDDARKLYITDRLDGNVLMVPVL